MTGNNNRTSGNNNASLPQDSGINWAAVGLTIFFSVVMFKCSFWQWDRYKEKVKLVAALKDTNTAPAINLPESALRTTEPSNPAVETVIGDLKYKKVGLTGTFDYEHQMVITNRKNAVGPGYLLMAPFRLQASGITVMVSRGFIPFAERDPKDWVKYNFDSDKVVTIAGLVQASVTSSSSYAPKNPESTGPESFLRIFYFEEVAAMAKQLQTPVALDLYVQQLGKPPVGTFPEEAISIQIPPSTHFGYTIEWALLGTLTLLGGVARQTYNFKKAKRLRSLRTNTA